MRCAAREIGRASSNQACVKKESKHRRWLYLLLSESEAYHNDCTWPFSWSAGCCHNQSSFVAPRAMPREHGSLQSESNMTRHHTAVAAGRVSICGFPGTLQRMSRQLSSWPVPELHPSAKVSFASVSCNTSLGIPRCLTALVRAARTSPCMCCTSCATAADSLLPMEKAFAMALAEPQSSQCHNEN